MMVVISPIRTLAETPEPYSGKEDGPAIPERLLARLWQRRAARQQGFRTDRGLRVRVLYPGRPGNSAGPDFRDALLELEGVGLVQGDVEIHRRQQDWDAHGHNDDPNYNSVVLHAALETHSSDTRVPSGQPISVVSLAPLLEDEASGQAPPTLDLWGMLARLGYPRPNSAAELGALLDRAGEVRFQAKSGQFQRFLAEQEAGQTLYEGLLEGLGYRHNQQPFLTLAARTPLGALERVARNLPAEEGVAFIESCLLKQSGLPLEEGAARVDLPGAGFGRQMSGREWHCFRVRPANHPRRRIAGAARLLARFLEVGLVAGLKAVAATDSPQHLVKSLTVAGDSSGGPAYIGRALAGDLAVNVALPFLHALAISEGEATVAESCLGRYHRFGKLQENELTREMSSQLLDPSWGKVITTACRQQGLLHLQRLLAGGTG